MTTRRDPLLAIQEDWRDHDSSPFVWPELSEVMAKEENVASLVDMLHNECVDLGRVSYQENEAGGWYADLTPDDVGKIRALVAMAGQRIQDLERGVSS